MDVRRLEEQVARATVAAEAAEARRERKEAERTRRRRAAAHAKAGEVTTGVDADGRWLSFVADLDPSGDRAALAVAAATLVAILALPLVVWWTLWTLPLWLVALAVTSGWLALRFGKGRTVRVVVTPRGYWALLVEGRLRASGRVEDLRVVVAGYRADSASHGLVWVAVHGPDGKLCESDQLTPASGAVVRAFVEAIAPQA